MGFGVVVALSLGAPGCLVDDGPPPLNTTGAEGDDGAETADTGRDDGDGDLPDDQLGPGCRDLDAVLLSEDGPAPAIRCEDGGPCPTFHDATAEAGLLFAHTKIASPAAGSCLFDQATDTGWAFGGDCDEEWASAGAAVGDVNADGLPDLFFSRIGAPDLLFENLGDGTFADISEQVGFTDCTNSGGAAFADLDRDGDVDLVVGALGGPRNRVYFNRLDEDLGFEEGPTGMGLAMASDAKHATHSIEVGDYDLDGRVDVLMHEWIRAHHMGENVGGSRLLRGTDDGFSDVTTKLGLRFEDAFETGHYGFSSAFADLDGDSRMDLAVAGDFGASRLFWNQGETMVPDSGLAQDAELETLSGMGMALGDVDNDGDLDWFMTGIYEDDPNECEGSCVGFGTGNRLLRNDGERVFTDVTDDAGVRNAAWAWGTVFVDLDNDGDLDLLAVNGWPGRGLDGTFETRDTEAVVWENDGEGNMTRWTDRGLTHLGQARTVLALDYDQDGDVDLVVTNHGDRPVLYRNDGGNAQAHLRVAVGVADSGTRVFVEGPGLSRQLRVVGAQAGHFGGHGERVLHFGMGDADLATRVEVWRPGAPEPLVFENVEVDQTIVLP